MVGLMEIESRMGVTRDGGYGDRRSVNGYNVVVSLGE